MGEKALLESVNANVKEVYVMGRWVAMVSSSAVNAHVGDCSLSQVAGNFYSWKGGSDVQTDG